jgi:hypothetical protein
MSDQIAANTEELRKDGFYDFTSKIAKAAEQLKSELAANANAVPENRCDTDKEVDELLQAARVRAEVIMKGLESIVGGGAEGVKNLASIFENTEEENEELGYQQSIRNSGTSNLVSESDGGIHAHA